MFSVAPRPRRRAGLARRLHGHVEGRGACVGRVFAAVLTYGGVQGVDTQHSSEHVPAVAAAVHPLVSVAYGTVRSVPGNERGGRLGIGEQLTF